MNIQSNGIIMYPVSNRNAQEYRDSRVSTEHNIISMLNKALNRSYIVSGLTVNSGKLSSGSAVIGGYIVDITASDTAVSAGSNEYLCLHIKVDTNKGRGELIAIDDNTLLDTNGYFFGLEITTLTESALKQLDKALSRTDEENIVHYYLPIAKYAGGKWDNLYCNENAEVGERVYGLKYAINDILIECKNRTDANYGTGHPMPLGEFLENYAVIDDGYVDE